MYSRKLLFSIVLAASGMAGSVGAAPLQSVEMFMPGRDFARLLFHRHDNSLIRNISTPSDGTVNRADMPEAAYVYCMEDPARVTPEFTRAKFRGRVFLPPDQPLRSYNLRLSDADGEVFQFRANVPKGDGQWHEIEFQVDAANPAASHWDGGAKADGKLTMPVKFRGVTGDFGAARGTFQVGPIVCDVLESNAPIAPELLTGSGSDIHVLKKGEEKELALSLRNPRPRRLSGVLKWSLTGVRGEALGEKEEKVALEPGGEKRFPLPEPAAFGVYKLQVEMTDDDPAVRPYRKEMRFAYLIPAGPTQGREPGFVFGIGGHPQRFCIEEQRKMAMAVGWCGAKGLREDINWARMQPSEGVWEFEFFDRIVDIFGEYGVELLPIYSYCAPWAVAKDWKPLNPAVQGPQRPDYDHWRKFIAAFAARYRNKMRFAEIWNEPELSIFANFSETEYVRMLEIAYQELKRIAPEWKVLTAGFSNILDKSDKIYNAAMIPAVIRSGKYDIFAYHGHFFFDKYQYQIKLLLSSGNRKPWFATETGISSTPRGEEEQARTLFHKLIFSWASGAVGYNWYNLRDKGFNPLNGEHHYGLLTNDFYPKPVYAAYNALSTLYRGGKFLREVRLGNGFYGFLFQGRDGAQLLAAWSTSGDGKAPLVVSGITGKAEIVDLYGNAQPLPAERGIANFEVGAEPLTLRVTGQSGALKVAGALLRPAGELKIEPGKEAVFTFELYNPEKRERSYRVRLTLPEGLSTDAKAETIQIAPDETKQISFPVRAQADFRSMPGKEKALTLALDNRSFRYRIDSVTPIAANGFRTEPDFVLDTSRQVQALISVAPDTAHLFWKGEQDLSAKVWLARDGGTLLLRAEVRDDKHVQPYSGAETSKGDNIQLWLVAPNRKIWEIWLTRLESGRSEVQVVVAPTPFQAKDTASKIALETSRDDQTGMTVYEARIPLSAIGLTEEAGRKGFQFNLIVNDNDESIRESFIEIAPGNINGSPERYPAVKF